MIAAKNIQCVILDRRNDSVSGIDEFSKIDPPSVRRIQDYHSRGVLPVYRGGIPTPPRVGGFPYKKRQSFEILTKLWSDVRDGRILICITKTVTEYDAIMCTPSTLVAKKLPGRTLSTEMRLISDARLINTFCDKTDYPACANPSLVDIAHRVEFSDRNFTGVERRVAKRDAGAAFTRVSTHPDCASIICTEFPGSAPGLPHDIIAFWSDLPFGWSSPTEPVQRCCT